MGEDSPKWAVQQVQGPRPVPNAFHVVEKSQGFWGRKQRQLGIRWSVQTPGGATGARDLPAAVSAGSLVVAPCNPNPPYEIVLGSSLRSSIPSLAGCVAAPLRSHAMSVRTVVCRVITLGALVLASGGEQWSSAQSVRLTVFRDRGGQVSWSPTGDDRIAYAAKGVDGYYDVHVADA